MTQHPSIAVTGATGNVGGSVARALSEAGTALRLVVRSRGRAPVLPGAAVAETSYGDHDAAVAALADVDTLFMVSASESADRLAIVRGFAELAQQHEMQEGVDVIVVPDTTL